MMSVRTSIGWTQKLLALTLIGLVSGAPVLAVPLAHKPEDLSLKPDKQYFQNVANHWIAGQTNSSTNPAVLKAGVSMTYDGYKLGPGDSITVQIPDLSFDEKVLSQADALSSILGTQAIVIRGNGEVTIPPFGTFNVAGMTVGQMSNMLEEMAGFYLVNPRVFVSLKSLRPYPVYLAGEVLRPGPYQTLNAPEQAYLAYADNAGSDIRTQQFFEARISLMLGKAGGVMPNADFEHVKVTNKETGKDITVNLLNLIRGDATQDVVLEPNDTVFVPKLAGGEQYNEEMAASTLTEREHLIRVIGYAQPRNIGGGSMFGVSGAVRLDGRHMTLHDALANMQIDPRADLTNIYILRPTGEEEFERIKVNATREQFKLGLNDTVYVPSVRPGYQLGNILAGFGSVAGAMSGLSVFKRNFWTNDSTNSFRN